MSRTSELVIERQQFEIDWESMTAAEGEALAAGLYDGECSYCGGEGGEPAGLDYYVPCPVCNDGRKS